MRHFYGVQSECSVVCNISPVVSVSRRNLFNNYLFNNPDNLIDYLAVQEHNA